MTNWMLAKSNLTYEGQIPSLAHQFLNGTITEKGTEMLESLKVAQNFSGDLAAFSTTYIDKLSEAYNYGFGVAVYLNPLYCHLLRFPFYIQTCRREYQAGTSCCRNLYDSATG